MMEVTNNNITGVVIRDPIFDDATLTSAGAATWPEGTLLGRITSSGKMTAYTVGASDGSENPIAVLNHAVTFAAAGDIADRMLVSGVVRRSKLVAFGVGDITIAEADALRDFTITTLTTTELSQLDNQ